LLNHLVLYANLNEFNCNSAFHTCFLEFLARLDAFSAPLIRLSKYDLNAIIDI
jgi:hypothetical protein